MEINNVGPAELKGKLDGFAVRVPTPNVSVVDLTVELGTPLTFSTGALGPPAEIVFRESPEFAFSRFLNEKVIRVRHV